MRRRVKQGGIPGLGCPLDTDGDGNCPRHPEGCIIGVLDEDMERMLLADVVQMATDRLSSDGNSETRQ